jgi:hypothetical protein
VSVHSITLYTIECDRCEDRVHPGSAETVDEAIELAQRSGWEVGGASFADLCPSCRDGLEERDARHGRMRLVR